MGGQEIYQPNPPPDPSQLSDDILAYSVKLNTQGVLSPEELSAIQQFRKASDFISAGTRHILPVSDASY